MAEVEPVEVTLRVTPKVGPRSYLRKGYNDWIADVEWYKAHPEEECPPSYLATCSFEEYVAAILHEVVVPEMVEAAKLHPGFKIEVVNDVRRTA